MSLYDEVKRACLLMFDVSCYDVLIVCS